MLVQQKADIASGTTVSLSGFGLWMHYANGWVSEFMPLITAFGIVGGFLLTAWYYWKSIQQRQKDREVERQKLEDHIRQREHELRMARGWDDNA